MSSKVKKLKLNKDEDQTNQISLFKYIKPEKETETQYKEVLVSPLKRKRESNPNVFCNNQNDNLDILEKSMDGLTLIPEFKEPNDPNLSINDINELICEIQFTKEKEIEEKKTEEKRIEEKKLKRRKSKRSRWKNMMMAKVQ